MKRIIIFVIVGLVMFGIGFGGGLLLGRTMAGGEGESGGGGRQVAEPGPIIPIGEFTSNLTGAGRHVISFTLSLELLNADDAVAIIQNPGWLAKIRNEVLLIVKDKVYDDLTSAEGALQFAGDIKRTLNGILPDVKGEAPVVQALFESFVLQ
ncbi:MAG: flagellar basal body-associated FliL family protein [Synergistaceae bacterium]|nr:flagellar basal body-associated FliL family protein [Synergistaceae bacterium]